MPKDTNKICHLEMYLVLLNIKNYIYSKAILSKLNARKQALEGIYKGKHFSISLHKDKNTRHKKAQYQIVLQIDKKKFYPKHSREIVRFLK